MMCEINLSIFAFKLLSSFKITSIVSIYCLGPRALGPVVTRARQPDNGSTISHPKIGAVVHQGECDLMRWTGVKTTDITGEFVTGGNRFFIGPCDGNTDDFVLQPSVGSSVFLTVLCALADRRRSLPLHVLLSCRTGGSLGGCRNWDLTQRLAFF